MGRRITEAQIEAATKRIHAKLRRRFPIGCTVKMTASAARMFPRYRDRPGKVVGYFRRVSPKVLFKGRKTADSWHPDFFKRVRT